MGNLISALDRSFNDYYNIVRNRSLYVKIINDILNMDDQNYNKIGKKYNLSKSGFFILISQYKYRDTWDREFRYKPKDLIFNKNNLLKTTSFLRQMAIIDHINFYGLEKTHTVYPTYEIGVLEMIIKDKCWHLANYLSNIYKKISIKK